MIVIYWNAKRHNWQLEENQTGISTENCSNVRIKSSARSDHHPPSHKLKDFSMWNILQEKVYKTRITDLDDLKHRIRTKWAKLDRTIIATAVHLCHCASVPLSGIDVFQLVWRWMVVILSTVFNSDIRTVVSWYFGLIFLQLSVTTLCILIHDDRLIHKVK